MESAVLLFGTYAGAIFGAVLGACLASFGCVVGERLPAGRSLGGRSHCACGRQLNAYENVPVLGWLLLGGRTRCCKVRLPVRYVLWEVALAVLFGILGQWIWNAYLTGTLNIVMGVGASFAAAAAFLAVCVLTRDRALGRRLRQSRRAGRAAARAQRRQDRQERRAHRAAR